MHQIFLRQFVGPCVLALLAPVQVSAATPAQDSATIARLARQVETSRLRISGTSGQVEALRATIATDGVHYDSLAGSDPTTIVVPWSDIHRLERQGSGAVRGALIGGGISVFLALASIATNDCPGPAEQVCGLAVAANLLAIPVGTGIGALIGSRFQRWKTVYRRP
jgi:hypothetical protein